MANRLTKAAKKVKGAVRRRTLKTGDSDTPLTQWTKQELYNRARQLDVAGRSSMSKSQLVSAIRRAQ